MTKRALAPLALDLQAVIGNAPGRGLELSERVTPAGPVAAGQPVQITLTVANRGRVPANEVVVNDVAPASLTYVPGTTEANGHKLSDPPSGTPLSRDPAKIGLNLGTVVSGASVTLSYQTRSLAPVDTRPLRLLGRISSRESVVPAPANISTPASIDQLARVRGVPGVAAADSLAFVDLPPGSLSTANGTIQDTVRSSALTASTSDIIHRCGSSAGIFNPAPRRSAPRPRGARNRGRWRCATASAGPGGPARAAGHSHC